MGRRPCREHLSVLREPGWPTPRRGGRRSGPWPPETVVAQDRKVPEGMLRDSPGWQLPFPQPENRRPRSSPRYHHEEALVRRLCGRGLLVSAAGVVIMKPRSVHRLKVTLRGVKPPVWRRIVVYSDCTLGELAPLLEASMGWLGGHLHLFDVGGTRYGTPDPDWDTADLHEGRFRLGDVLPSVGSKMRWEYDFGDGWEHDVVVEAIGPPEAGVRYPRCLAGRRACPPEDCGGPWGYEELLQALADPGNPDHAELREWAPPDFDPVQFDPVEATLAMHLPRPLEGW